MLMIMVILLFFIDDGNDDDRSVDDDDGINNCFVFDDVRGDDGDLLIIYQGMTFL